MKKTQALCSLLSIVLVLGFYPARAQQDPGFNFPPYEAPPQAKIQFYEGEIQKCKEYIDELTIGINKAEILFANTRAKNRHPFAGFNWTNQIYDFERQIEVVCHRIKLHQANIQEEMDKVPPAPSPTPTPSPSPSPSKTETKSDESSDSTKNKLIKEFNEEIKFINGYRRKLNELKVGANKVFKDIDDYLKKNNPTEPLLNFTSETRSSGGLSTTTFTTPQGRIIVNLPADMRAGDAISGTVLAEPNGQTEDERTRNLASLNSYQLKIANETVRAPWGTFRWAWTKRTPQWAAAEGQPTTARPETLLIDLIAPISNEKGMGPVARQNISEGPSVVSPSKIQLPAFGQNGRPGQIRGPFDGNSTTTDIKIGGQPITVIAESPRSCIFQSPEQNFGPTEITVKENNVETKGAYRNLGVRLSAPKTNLLKGESTTVTITVEGLKGIQQNVPLQLEKKGDVSMEGGDVQTIQIRPNDVVIEGVEAKADIRKVVVGLRPGVFKITATVIDPRLRPIIIPLVENGNANGYRVKKDGPGFVINVENVKHPITGDPVDGEHKLEHQCPTLAKIPYINRLFLNKGIGKAKSECLILITPRIIIQESN